MQVPPGLLRQPEYRLTPEMRSEFDEMLEGLRDSPDGGPIGSGSTFPKWQFLSYVCRADDLVLHGSCEPGIAELEPREADDVRAYSAQKAIYATTDGIWAIFFAILNRRDHKIGTTNTCFTVTAESEESLGTFYYFSVSQHALDAGPWSAGAVYVLPRVGFSQEEPREYGGALIAFPHWISNSAARPYGYLTVGPEDFPFLGDVRGHDDEEHARRYRENPEWRPWETG